MNIARVFPQKTSMTPVEPNCYWHYPLIWTPKYDEVHISVTFTWDLPMVEKLALQWSDYGEVKIGGPALDDPGNGFEPGVYLKEGITITSRGCPNNCDFCFVPRREGKIRELPIKPGHIVQDNNLLACSKGHIRKVFEMLRHQSRIDFSGGLESARVTDEIVEELRGLKIYQLWLSYDRPGAKEPLKKAIEKLSRYFRRDQIRCYVLIGYENDTLDKAESRLREAWEIGTLPFAMRYRTPKAEWSGTFLFKQRAWNELAAKFTQPKITKAIMKGV